MASTDVATGTDTAYAVAIQADGKIVAAGSSGNLFGAARYSPTDGQLDSSFSGDGKQTVSPGGSSNIAYAVAIQADQKIVIGGYADGFTGSNGPSDFAIARLGTDGNLDSSFGSSGIRLTNVVGGSFIYDKAFSLAIQRSDSKIVVAGSTGAAGTEDLAVVRYTADGNEDVTFDTDGKVTTGVNSSDVAYAVALDAQGDIVTAGYTSGSGVPADFLIIRYGGGGLGGVRTYVEQDANFNVTALTDRGGTVLERYRYTMFGVQTVLNADNSVDADNVSDQGMVFGWQGGRLETATGTLTFGRRDLRPTLGRWIEQDPAGYVNGSSLYLYELGSPANLLDPSGLNSPPRFSNP